MKIMKKGLALLLGLLLAVSFSGCDLPAPGFVDYDVSGYIQALLDSSYHGDSEALIEKASMTEEQVLEYNSTTVENAAVTFCNMYGVAPTDEQLQKLQKIMKQAFALTKYTVKEERKTDTGYYLEVEIAPITNFAGRETEIQQLKEKARAELTPASMAASSSRPESAPEEESDLEEESDASSSSAPEPAPEPDMPQEEEVAALFVEKVLAFCEQELANIHYDQETRIIPMDIRQTEAGELQLDLEQIEKIDKTVVLFTK